MGGGALVATLVFCLLVGCVIAVFAHATWFITTRQRSVAAIARSAGFADAETDDERQAVNEAVGAFRRTAGENEWNIHFELIRRLSWAQHVLLLISNPMVEGSPLALVIATRSATRTARERSSSFSSTAKALGERWVDKPMRTLFAVENGWTMVRASLGDARNDRIESAIEECQRVAECLLLSSGDASDN